jgi:hypothetical protein
MPGERKKPLSSSCSAQARNYIKKEGSGASRQDVPPAEKRPNATALLAVLEMGAALKKQ